MSVQHRSANADAAGPAPAHTTVLDRRGKPFVVLDELPHLEPKRALATVELPLRVDWSPPFTPRELGDRSHRLEVYARLLREGRAEDIASYVDGDLLLDAWDDMYLPREIRAAWQPVIDAARVRV